MKKTKLLVAGLVGIGAIVALAGCVGSGGGDKYDKDGNLKLTLRNLYFSDWTATDVYTSEIQKKFGVSITPSTYDWNSWSSQVSGAINGNHLTDVFHYDIESFNFGNTYETWAKGGSIKALPNDMSKWPNIKSMLDDISNLNALKINGKLYGIPLAYDISNPEKDFSSFTYVYRRDWAKEIDERNKDTKGWQNILKDNDVYTWDEFNRLVKAFNKYSDSENIYAMADVEWGFPSITNFYKDVPHCYIKDENGTVQNAFVSDSYIEGLKVAKDFVKNKYYGYDQYSAVDGSTYNEYKAGHCGIYYENLSLSNYTTLRADVKKNQKTVNLDDATAIMKVMGPDRKYALEGTDNWFSMTMFNGDISDKKQEKILDIIDYLLSEEGTRLAIYGIEGYDYEMVNGEVQLLETGWEKDLDGKYISKSNGAKYLRYLATLGYDTKGYDPLVDADSYKIVTDWNKEMSQAKAQNKLRVIMEDADIKWLSTPQKNSKTSGMLEDANDAVMSYCYDKIKTIDSYKTAFSTTTWVNVLKEINDALKK